MSDKNESRIRELISEINQYAERTQTEAWKFNRIRLLEIDDLGGYSKLTDGNGNQLYKHDKDFIATEFAAFSKGWLQSQRTTGRIERIVGLPIGTVSSDYFEPFRQFWVRKNKGASNTGSGTSANPVGEEKIKKAWVIACELAVPNPPSKCHIEQAVAIMAERGEAKATVNRCTMRKRNKETLKQQVEFYQSKCEQLEFEVQELTDYKKFVDAENERLRTENKRLRSMFKSVA